MPIRVVLGPANKAYVIDHHHLGLALLKENFKSAPMHVEADFSHLPLRSFWKRMRADHFLYLVSAKGTPKPLRSLPRDLECLKDDPYRSLAGFVRSAGGFTKPPLPSPSSNGPTFSASASAKNLFANDSRIASAKASAWPKAPPPPSCPATPAAGCNARDGDDGQLGLTVDIVPVASAIHV
jgi:hypothetical protein